MGAQETYKFLMVGSSRYFLLYAITTFCFRERPIGVLLHIPFVSYQEGNSTTDTVGPGEEPGRNVKSASRLNHYITIIGTSFS